MTRLDIYCGARDRDIIINREWSTNYRYIKIGSKVIQDSGHFITTVNMLTEKDTDQWMIKGQISKLDKLRLRLRMLRQVWRQTSV